jgi:hypothetical protein
MKKHLLKLSLLTLAAALLAVPSLRAQDAATATPPAAPSAPADSSAPAAPAPKKHGAGLPVHGKIAAIDTTANTVTIGKLTLNVTEKTKIRKNGATGTISDLAVGDVVKGAYKKDKEGNLNLLVLTVGGKKPAAN